MRTVGVRTLEGTMAYYGLNYQQAQAQRRDKAAFGIILAIACLIIGALWTLAFSNVERLGLSEETTNVIKFWLVVLPLVLIACLLWR